MATKKKAKKLKGPKPSLLLEEALELFGPHGEYWITGEENETREEGYLYDGTFYDLYGARDKMTGVLTDATDSIDDPKEFAKAAKAAADRVAKEFVYQEGAEMYCSLGAIKEVNTANEDLALDFLAQAIDGDYRKAKKVEHDGEDVFGCCACAKCSYEPRDIVTTNNDNLGDDYKGSFPTIRKWFKKAIKLAQAVGQ